MMGIFKYFILISSNLNNQFILNLQSKLNLEALYKRIDKIQFLSSHNAIFAYNPLLYFHVELELY
jgi:hypothetical protein